MDIRRPAGPGLRPRLRPDGNGAVSPIELFFDLVFVFALTQVTAAMAADLSTGGLFRGLLVLALLWWAWVGYSWLANVAQADEGLVKLVLLVSMGTMLVITLAVPEAFEDLPGGLHGPTVLALGYFVFRILHLVLFWIVAQGDAGLRRRLLRFLPSVVGGTVLLLVAAQLDGLVQILVWVAALAVDYGGTFLGGASGWRLVSAAHFAERHGLIVIVALGESIVAIGVGIAALPISTPIIIGAVLGLTLAGALWWVYFDVSQAAGERALAAVVDVERARLARTAYSFWHMPMVAGVAFLAVGIKKVLEYAGDTESHDLADPASAFAVIALCIGVAAFLVAMVAFAQLTKARLMPTRIAGAVVVLALIPVGLSAPGLVTLALVTGVVLAVAAVETVAWSGVRDAIRHDAHA